MPDNPRAGWSDRVAVAVIRSDVPQIFLASDQEVLGRLLALRIVAKTPAASLPDAPVSKIRSALLEERWGDALGAWINATGEIVDAYPDDEVWTDERLDSDLAMLELRLSPIFQGDIDEDDDDHDD